MLGQWRWDRRTAVFVAGASMIALCIAARRLGLGVDDDGGPALWLALLFVVGASLMLIVLAGRLIAVLKKR
ncbi:hypothetical protein [Arthrobacter sp. SX1312]|uniref:hypothetical protein n=1 Tax=Arthrobacter sp. SX1312 TaxID=2058896 RepID=UPI0011B0A272|nr:hypothetical protein [Arthrobacter sp. SX1312]